MCPRFDDRPRSDDDDDGFPGPMDLVVICVLLVILILWACLTIPVV
jgi:hypothetical protein